VGYVVIPFFVMCGLIVLFVSLNKVIDKRDMDKIIAESERQELETKKTEVKQVFEFSRQQGEVASVAKFSSSGEAVAVVCIFDINYLDFFVAWGDGIEEAQEKLKRYRYYKHQIYPFWYFFVASKSVAHFAGSNAAKLISRKADFIKKHENPYLIVAWFVANEMEKIQQEQTRQKNLKHQGADRFAEWARKVPQGNAIAKCAVYIIAGGEHSKVGVSNDPDKRLKQLQTGNPTNLFIHEKFWFKSENKARQVEQQAHKALKKHRQAGEWFSISPVEAERVVRGISDGDFFVEDGWRSTQKGNLHTTRNGVSITVFVRSKQPLRYAYVIDGEYSDGSYHTIEFAQEAALTILKLRYS
jgi:hypothetical protein